MKPGIVLVLVVIAAAALTVWWFVAEAERSSSALRAHDRVLRLAVASGGLESDDAMRLASGRLREEAGDVRTLVELSERMGYLAYEAGNWKWAAEHLFEANNEGKDVWGFLDHRRLLVCIRMARAGVELGLVDGASGYLAHGTASLKELVGEGAPSYAESQEHWGRCHEVTRELTVARDVYAWVASRYEDLHGHTARDTLEVRLSLSRVHRELGALRTAESMAVHTRAHAIKRFPSTDRLVVSLDLELAICAGLLGNRERASKHFDRAQSSLQARGGAASTNVARRLELKRVRALAALGRTPGALAGCDALEPHLRNGLRFVDCPPGVQYLARNPAAFITGTSVHPTENDVSRGIGRLRPEVLELKLTRVRLLYDDTQYERACAELLRLAEDVRYTPSYRWADVELGVDVAAAAHRKGFHEPAIGLLRALLACRPERDAKARETLRSATARLGG